MSDTIAYETLPVADGATEGWAVYGYDAAGNITYESDFFHDEADARSHEDGLQ